MSLRPRAIGLVAGLELRQRVRSVRWYIALATWFVLLTGLSLLIGGSFILLGAGSTMDSLHVASVVVFTLSVLLLVFAMLLIIPALSSGAINGDRTAGTLATLQATLLSPLEIVLGKVLAGWVIGLAFLVAALPSVVPSALIAGVGPLYLLRVLAAIGAITLFITAIGVGLSSLTARQLGSVVLSYLLVLGTTVILPVVYVCLLPLMLIQQDVTTYHSVQVGDTQEYRCEKRVERQFVLHTEVALPLLLVNPFVIVADAAPAMDLSDPAMDTGDVDGLRLISAGMRILAHPTHPSHLNDCWDSDQPGYPSGFSGPTALPVWPVGMGAYLGAAVGAVALATWRIRAPMRRIGAGTRVA